MRKINIVETILGITCFPAVILGFYMTFIYAPTERTMGDVQRIFYIHLPLAWISFLAFFIVFIAGVIYLITRSLRWDIIAHASAEIGVIFNILVIVSGSIWARSTWNTWWTWDPRLTTMLILLLIYLGYLMIRGTNINTEKKARISAVIGIVGFVNVPISFMAIRWWRSMHPVIITNNSMGLAPPMFITLMVCLGVITLLFAYLLVFRIKLGILEQELKFINNSIEE